CLIYHRNSRRSVRVLRTDITPDQYRNSKSAEIVRGDQVIHHHSVIFWRLGDPGHGDGLGAFGSAEQAVLGQSHGANAGSAGKFVEKLASEIICLRNVVAGSNGVEADQQKMVVTITRISSFE